MRLPDATNDKPDANADEEQRPGKFNEAAVEDIKLPQQEQETEGDQNDGANRLLAPPEERVDDVGAGRHIGWPCWIRIG
jgi:hypothetical protein